MARSTRTDGEQTRERILEVALPLFSDLGFAGTSVRNIAGAANVNVATLAYHFGDKEGLYEHVVQRLHQDLQQHFPTEPPAGGPRDILGWWVRAGWEFVRSHHTHVRLLVRHLLDAGDQPQVVLDRWSEPLMAQAEAVVGAFRPEWTTVQRRLLILMLMHLTVRLSLENPRTLARMAGMNRDNVDDEVVDYLTGLMLRELGLS